MAWRDPGSADRDRRPVDEDILGAACNADQSCDIGSQTQERAVDVQITRLRRKIEADPKQPRYLQTVRGEGYMLAPDQGAA